ncbi:MAG: DUF167 domain-containing protein [Elusimicrobiales bacterium]
MKISIRVKPLSSKKEVLKIDDKHYEIKLTSPPSEGKANNELREILADYFNISKSSVLIISGHRSRNKIVEIIK